VLAKIKQQKSGNKEYSGMKSCNKAEKEKEEFEEVANKRLSARSS
jgi:hypothetical protein